MKNPIQNTFLVLIIIATYSYYVFVNNITFSLYTFLFSFIVFGCYNAVKNNRNIKFLLCYAILAITPALTLSGQIGALTGFTRSENSLPWFGISFVSLGLAYLAFKNKLNVTELLLNILQPLRFSSGPVVNQVIRRGRFNFRRARIYFSWLVLGIFFYTVLAPGLAPLLFLKTSTYSVDILVFGIVFELYVYLNFAGISFMVYGTFGVAGVPIKLNFNAPFASKNIIEYWQRWHVSFGVVLKEMFFNPLQRYFDIRVVVVFVFMISAMWHGVTFNFVLWGLFHGLAWVATYQLARLPCAKLVVIINIIFLPAIVVLGRIIFAESDNLTLITKLSNLLNFQWSNEAYAANLILDLKTTLSLAAAFLYIASEIVFAYISVRYSYWRKTEMTVFLLLIIGLFGSTNLNSIYGTR